MTQNVTLKLENVFAQMAGSDENAKKFAPREDLVLSASLDVSVRIKLTVIL